MNDHSRDAIGLLNEGYDAMAVAKLGASLLRGLLQPRVERPATHAVRLSSGLRRDRELRAFEADTQPSNRRRGRPHPIAGEPSGGLCARYGESRPLRPTEGPTTACTP